MTPYDAPETYPFWHICPEPMCGQELHEEAEECPRCKRRWTIRDGARKQ